MLHPLHILSSFGTAQPVLQNKAAITDLKAVYKPPGQLTETMGTGDVWEENFTNASRLAFDAYALVCLMAYSCLTLAEIPMQEKWSYFAPVSQDKQQWEQLVRDYNALTPRERMVGCSRLSRTSPLLTS